VEFPREAVLARSSAFLRDAGVASSFLVVLIGIGGVMSTRRVTRPLEGALVASESALAASEARFRALVEGAPNGMVMVDASGTIVLANAELERVFGYERGELTGRGIETLVPVGARGTHPAQRAAYHRSPERRAMGAGRDLFGLRKDGTEVPVEIGINPVERNGERFIVASVVDISDRKEAELELRRSNDELQRFAYVASHDLQEPLRTVASYVQLLERRYKDKLDDDAREFINFAADGARRMQRLVEDLLLLSRVGSRGLDLVPTEADAVVDAAIADLELTIAETGATISRSPLPIVRGDFRQLQQLFANLIGNAIKFRGASAPVLEIGARREGSHHVFHVRDHGIGIEPQYYERIFVIFQRLHGRDEYPGTGIGLAICKKIIERHAGRIWVESAPGQGSTFFFSLPVHREA
jgi:PAS domain S-box-containing protein